MPPPPQSSVASFETYVALHRPLTRLGSARPPSAAELVQLTLLLSAGLAWRPDPASQVDLVRTIRRLDRQVESWEDRELFDLALAEIPLQDLYSSLPEDASVDDHLAFSLAKWFKEEYMSWVDPIDCRGCQGPTESRGSGTPTEEEIAKGAGRVELLKCTDCGRTNRFPRYNDLRTLMKTRTGRCGEYANLFMLFLRAVGLRARYVWCREDHVWCEYWSSTKGRWIHVDPSEGKTDRPLLYALGWTKTFTYILAFSTVGARDVTLSYLPSVTFPPGRVLLGERDLQRFLKWITRSRRVGLTVDERRAVEDEEREERRWERDWRARIGEEEERAVREGREGRVSGGAEWKQSRGEGLGSAEIPLTPVDVDGAPFFDLRTASPTLQGASRLQNSTLSLTPAQADTIGAAFLPIPLPMLNTSFISSLTFCITLPPSGQAADGMAFGVFVLPEGATPGLGEGGAGMGYEGVSKDGWVVEIDTYQTFDRTRDPPAPHISLHCPPHPHHRHSLSHTPPSALPPLTDGQPYTLRIHSRPGSVDVRLKEGMGDDMNGSEWVRVCGSDRRHLIRGAEGDSKVAWLGVTAACGGFFEAHEVLDWKVWVLPDEGSG